MNNLEQAAKSLIATIVDAFRAFTDAVCKVASMVLDTIISQVGVNGRVYHLARYAKKRRVRKKNRNRLIKEIMEKVSDYIANHKEE